MPSPPPFRLGPLLLALLLGCAGSSPSLRVEKQQHTSVVHVHSGTRTPVQWDKAAFQKAFVTWAPFVQPSALPLQEARRLWLTASLSAPYSNPRKHLGLVSLGSQQEVPPAYLLSEFSGADTEITRGYGVWCREGSKPLDCLQLQEGSALLSRDGKRALALHFAFASLWEETGMRWAAWWTPWPFRPPSSLPCPCTCRREAHFARGDVEPRVPGAPHG